MGFLVVLLVNNSLSGRWIFLASRLTIGSLDGTLFWKTDHLLTRTDREIHLLPVYNRHTHALSKKTKH